MLKIINKIGQDLHKTFFTYFRAWEARWNLITFSEDFCILVARMDNRIYFWNSDLLGTSSSESWYMSFLKLIIAPCGYRMTDRLYLTHKVLFYLIIITRNVEKKAKEELMTLRIWENVVLVKYSWPGLVWDFSYLLLSFLRLCQFQSWFLSSEVAITITVRFSFLLTILKINSKHILFILRNLTHLNLLIAKMLIF